MQKMMSKLKLTVNGSKMRVCSVPEEKFDFLGYTFGQCWTSLSWHRSSAKAGATHLWGNTRNDRTEYNLVGSSNNSDEAQPHNVRMGELLLSCTRQYGLSRCRRLRDDEAAAVVANET
jgi:hypothetical protein